MPNIWNKLAALRKLPEFQSHVSSGILHLPYDMKPPHVFDLSLVRYSIPHFCKKKKKGSQAYFKIHNLYFFLYLVFEQTQLSDFHSNIGKIKFLLPTCSKEASIDRTIEWDTCCCHFNVITDKPLSSESIWVWSVIVHRWVNSPKFYCCPWWCWRRNAFQLRFYIYWYA